MAVVTLHDQLVNSLREQIASGDQPPGEALNIQRLADSFNVSITPVREALRQLCVEGFVDYSPRRGFRVLAPSISDAEDVYSARLFFEPEALRRSLANSSPQWLVKVESAYEALQRARWPVEKTTTPTEANGISSWILVHKQFHLTLLEQCPSTWWLNLCKRLADESDRFRPLRIRAGGEPLHHESSDAHHHLTMAILALDENRAVDALITHLNHSLESFRSARRMANSPNAKETRSEPRA